MAVGLWGLRLLRAAAGGGAGRKFIATSTASHLSPTELIEMQNDLFNKEKKRQLSLTPRTEKIEVKHVGKTDPGTLFVMNKNISTPYSCAMHLGEWYCRKSILALVDGQPWDMYKPLTKSCDIKFLTFKDRDPGEVNKAYWRSCAMMMGCVIERAFKDEYVVSLVRAPEVPVIAGAFCYDVVLDKRLDEWMPSKENLRSFTKDARALIYKDLPFETLEVDAKVALEIFQHNKYKIDYIEEKASQNPERVVKLHRFGDFIDVSEGPLIPRTSICFQYEVSAVHNLQATQSSLVRRFQGLSLPVHLRAHFTVWHKLLERSRKMGQKMKATANMMPQGPGPPKILHLSYCFISLLLSLSALPLEPRWQTANSWRLLARPSLSAPLPPRVVSSLSILSQSAHHTALERLGLECFIAVRTSSFSSSPIEFRLQTASSCQDHLHPWRSGQKSGGDMRPAKE